jgi:metallophosphoesterase (TIGR03767 family)
VTLSRREFLTRAGVAGAAAGTFPWWFEPDLLAAPADLTTLGRTIVKGAKIGEGSLGAYYRLREGPGERHIVRAELMRSSNDARGGLVGTEVASRELLVVSAGGRRPATPLLTFVHLTDVHIVDAQSPARVEFLDRFADPGRGCESVPFSSAFRPQEQLTLQVLEAMVRAIRRVRRSPVTGKKLGFAVCTGDNIDNEQLNELRWFIDTLDGGKRVSSNSGGKEYEGVQRADWGDPEYWHPDPKVPDKFKQQWGFPDYPGLFEAALKPFRATGIGMPWLQTFGNHDGLMQGNTPRNPVFEGIAVGPAKIMALPPGVNPCDAFQTLRDNPSAFLAAPAHPVAADPERKILRRAEYIEEMFKSSGTPVGHGFRKSNRDDGIAYWFKDAGRFRLIGLDTVNPGGYDEGSLGMQQFTWLEERIREVSRTYLDGSGEETRNKDAENKYVILFSHHGLRSLENPFIAPDPQEPRANDLPRVLADQVQAVLHRYPNVIAWVNGHTHENIVQARNGAGGGFWDIGTAAHIDWACQSRLIDVVDNHDGTMSIWCTMLDHAAPVTPGGADDVLRVASISRELAANDFQKGFDSKGRGKRKDRNVELVLRKPF